MRFEDFVIAITAAKAASRHADSVLPTSLTTTGKADDP
jgi:hypothetical protein